ncbi:MAG TPA: glycosyltransferase family A protein [Solirubrobacteraceae bacterium]|nr:glycosyltransferase family A protein [Solirubrobacteraceae bacterium]
MDRSDTLNGSASAAPRIAVVIPAHQGERTISRSLGSIAEQRWCGPLEVVVVCNGCRDATAERAVEWQAAFARRQWTLSVIESPPGRIAAINAGEAGVHPAAAVAIVDQDACLGPDTLDALATVLHDGDRHFAAPTVRVRSVGGIVDRYYRAWQRLPYVVDSPVTIGCYAMSGVGRRRRGQLPDGVPDDKFTRMRFTRAERAVTPRGSYEVIPPEGFTALLAARRRYRASNQALDRSCPGLGVRARRERLAGMASWACAPRHWIDGAVLVAVHVLARLPARG